MTVAYVLEKILQKEQFWCVLFLRSTVYCELYVGIVYCLIN